MKKQISEQVVVITGASSGIGRETALQLARRGATVIAAARNQAALETLASQAIAAGGPGRIEWVVTDVTDARQVEALAMAAIRRFGRIDTWVNNAAVSMYATVAESSVEEMQRILTVNLLGQIHGIKAVLPHMRAQRSGTIINVSATVGWRGVPYQAAYVASKHGIKGFTDTLRLELIRDDSGIDVTLIVPSSINTPLFQHARSKLGVLPRPIPPVYQPSLVAQAIINAAEHTRRDIVIGGWGKALVLAERISPWLTDWYMLWNERMFRLQQTMRPDDGRDNLFAPIEGTGQIHGLFGDETRMRSPYTRIFELHPWTRTMIMATAGITLIVPFVGVAASFGVVSAATRATGALVGRLARAVGVRRGK